MNSGDVSLERKLYDLTEVVVRPKKMRQKTLGITKSIEMMLTWCFSPGCEAGILMSNKKTSFIKEVNLYLNLNSPNMHGYEHNSVFLRINIYKVNKDMQFENILVSPVFYKQGLKKKITVDVRHHNIVVDGDFLVTFEILEKSCRLCFPTKRSQNHYLRSASQGRWIKESHGISISVLVDVER
jgi:hypothetical protein